MGRERQRDRQRDREREGGREGEKEREKQRAFYRSVCTYIRTFELPSCLGGLGWSQLKSSRLMVALLASRSGSAHDTKPMTNA